MQHDTILRFDIHVLKRQLVLQWAAVSLRIGRRHLGDPGHRRVIEQPILVEVEQHDNQSRGRDEHKKQAEERRADHLFCERPRNVAVVVNGAVGRDGPRQVFSSLVPSLFNA